MTTLVLEIKSCKAVFSWVQTIGKINIKFIITIGAISKKSAPNRTVNNNTRIVTIPPTTKRLLNKAWNKPILFLPFATILILKIYIRF